MGREFALAILFTVTFWITVIMLLAGCKAPEPEPLPDEWTAEQERVFLADIREECDRGWIQCLPDEK